MFSDRNLLRQAQDHSMLMNSVILNFNGFHIFHNSENSHIKISSLIKRIQRNIYDLTSQYSGFVRCFHLPSEQAVVRIDGMYLIVISVGCFGVGASPKPRDFRHCRCFEVGISCQSPEAIGPRDVLRLSVPRALRFLTLD